MTQRLEGSESILIYALEGCVQKVEKSILLNDEQELQFFLTKEKCTISNVGSVCAQETMSHIPQSFPCTLPPVSVGVAPLQTASPATVNELIS